MGGRAPPPPASQSQRPNPSISKPLEPSKKNMEFASVALNTLLPKLARLLQDEYKLQTKGVRDGIEFLYSELRTMQAALEKFGEVPIEQLDKLQRIWAQDVRDLSYDMEDIVDTFMVDVAGPDPPGKKSVKRIFKKLTRKVTKAMARHEIAKEIKGIRERVREVAERRDRYKVDTITPANKTLVDPRLKALYTEATRLVGIDEAKEEVITKLALGDDYQNKRIVSIAGFGGLGKTTLAKAVYDEIGRHFDCRAFVSVSRNLDAKKLLKDMMYELDRGKFSLCASLDDIKHLIDLVHEILQKKRYLIVIDDIWNIEHWDVIVLALIENNKGSRIITTTRIIDVASKVGGCYMLKPLSPENSKNLFYGRIFGSKDKCPSNILDVSEKILKKCGGVPLAIITTSSLLANKSEDIKEWHDVCDSIGYGLQKKPGMDSMRKILLLSYYDLPSHLKTCLLYLSIFPEDYVIRKERLIWRWVAEGFVQDQQVGDQSFLEIGKSYFNELINRSLIQPAVMDLDDTPKACRVHDIVLDLIISLSMEECFVTTVYDGDGKLSLGSKQEVRRLSLHNYTTWPTMNMAKLRSLTIFEPVVSILTHFDAVVGSMPALSSYHLLRVLDLRDYKVKDLATMGFVGSLSHLRYLGLSKTSSSSGVDRLLVEIGKLRFLQTLDVSKTEVEEVPSSIVEGLRQLKCLRGNNYKGISLPDGLKNLTSLEVLESVAATSECIAKELGYLIQLRVLGVSIRIPHLMHMSVNNSGDDGWRAFANALVESLGKLKKIESLRIHCNHFAILCFDSSMEPLGNLRRLHIDIAWVVPAWIEPASLSCLSCLNISVCYEQRADIQVLGTLPCLRHLTYRVAYSTLGTDEPMERCVVGPDAFPCLVRCDLFIPGGMVPSMFPRGAMPKLEDFTFNIGREQFWNHGESDVDDLALDHLPSLRSVTVNDLYGYIVDEARKNKVKNVREKLEHEAAVHPNHPLRIHYTGQSTGGSRIVRLGARRSQTRQRPRSARARRCYLHDGSTNK